MLDRFVRRVRQTSVAAASAATISALILFGLAACGNSGDDQKLQAVLTHTVGGSVSGVSDWGLVLQMNTGESLAIPEGATQFTFTRPLQAGSTYTVTISSAPPLMNCSIEQGDGTVRSIDITNIAVACVPGPDWRDWHAPAFDPRG